MRVSRAARFVVVCTWLGTVSSCTRSEGLTHAGFVDAPEAAVAAPISGQVVEILVREGDRVSRGQVMARLDTREQAALLGQAEANVLHAQVAVREAEQNARAAVPSVKGAEADSARQQAELEDATLEFERQEAITRAGAATQSKLDAARARVEQARAAMAGMGAAQLTTRGRVTSAFAAVRTARAALLVSEAARELSRVQLAEAEIKSPFDGLVMEQNLQPGEWAAPGTPVVTVEDLSRKWVRIDLEETALGALRLGQPVRVRVIAFPSRSYRGHVMEIGAEGDFALNRDVKRGRPDVRTFRVRIAFDEAAAELRPGMTAEVDLATVTVVGP